MTKHEIIFGDSRDALKDIAPESIALVVTSPPYFVGREYESYLADEGEYWQLMKDVFSQMSQVVEPYGKVAINFADRYANAKLMGKQCEVLYAHKFDEIMQKAGFVLWSRVIWDKVRVFIDGATHLAAPTNKTGQMRIAPNWEYILIWRKDSAGPIPVKKLDMTREERISWSDGIWTFSSVSQNEKAQGFKQARFPEELPRRLIRMYTQQGDTVLDPFLGTGTTTKAAMNLNRNSVGIELNREMLLSMDNYLSSQQMDLFGERPEINYTFKGKE